MSTGLKVVIIVIAIVLLYLAYRYFFITNVNKTIPAIPVHSANATGSNVILSTISSKCLALPKMQSDIADLLGIYQASAQNVINGTMPERGGAITDPVVLMNLFKEAEYNYNNAIIQHNSIISADKCQGETAIIPTVVPIPVPATVARTTVPGIDCNSLAYRQKLSLLQINYEQAKVQYQLAIINKNNYDVAETRQKFTQAEKTLEKTKTEFENYYKLCNK